MFPRVLLVVFWANDQIQGGGDHGNFRFIAQLNESCGHPEQRLSAIVILGGEKSRGTEHLTCRIWCSLQVNSVITEINCSTYSWCQRELLGVGEKTHTPDVASVVTVVHNKRPKKFGKKKKRHRGRVSFFPPRIMPHPISTSICLLATETQDLFKCSHTDFLTSFSQYPGW